MDQRADDYFSMERIRRGVINLLLGRAANGFFSVSVVLIIAQSLPVAGYSAYIIFLSIIQLCLFMSSMGVVAIAVNNVPRYRNAAGSHRLLVFILKLLAFRLGTLLAVALLLGALSGAIVELYHIQSWKPLMLPVILVVVISGVPAFFQRCVFEPLVLQGWSQLNWMVRNVSMFVLLAGTLLVTGDLTLSQALWFEVVANLLSTLVAVLQFTTYMTRLRRSEAGRTFEGWENPSLRSLAGLALYDHSSYMLQLVGNTQAVLLVAGHFLDPASMSAFGFSMVLAEQIRNYLPASLLWQVFHPAMVVSYATDRDFETLNRWASLMHKASLLVLGPIIALFLINGEGVLDLLSRGKFGDSWAITVGALVMLIPLSHKVVLWGVALTVGRPDAIALGGLTSLLVVPLVFAALSFGGGALELVGIMTFAVLLDNAIAIASLHRMGFQYRIHLQGMAKFGAAVAGSTLLLYPFAVQDGTVALVAEGTMIGLSFLALLALLNPLTAFERHQLDGLLRRRHA